MLKLLACMIMILRCFIYFNYKKGYQYDNQTWSQSKPSSKSMYIIISIVLILQYNFVVLISRLILGFYDIHTLVNDFVKNIGLYQNLYVQ